MQYLGASTESKKNLLHSHPSRQSLLEEHSKYSVRSSGSVTSTRHDESPTDSAAKKTAATREPFQRRSATGLVPW
jgi:hypothetical protein